MNNVIDTIMARKSIRAYQPEQLSPEQLDNLVKVALTSPTAVNAQGWHFTVIQNKNIINEIEADIVAAIMAGDNEAAKERTKARGNKVVYDAPTLIIISGKPSAYSHIDAGIAVQSLAIAAKSMGLDSVILGMVGLAFKGENGERWANKLNFPQEHEFIISIAIGKGAMEGNHRELDPTKVTYLK
ncbi:nitroreductase family protein [Tyzzerella sp. OttesenSCG-928-J15]|nr:nitroreductase family protein [Tyzzerella sp. OttesenSCG-928-J15]